ncbi:MAG: RagB/SusD family nutrient uptake outer membrane protein, partial [Dysgonamonadaceae bacterium]|nr:RagB/SusD family nutrient uptake outer membrane protein [Dysgonamonadaceae bacterium]
MKKYLFIITICCSIAPSLVSCEDDLLKKPFGSDLDAEKVFSSREIALSAISEAYFRSLMSGITLRGSGDWNWGLSGGTLSHLSGELCNNGAANWVGVATITNGGLSASRETDDNFEFNYKAIRQCYLVIENIDNVPDMTADEKNQVKAEMKTLIAYRYEEMFKRYGGVPIVDRPLTLEDDMMIPRSGLQEVLDHIVTLCDEAFLVLPDVYPDNFKGRVTKGVALAIKAEALMYAARPLFNSAVPYMDLGANNHLICFGNYSEQRWRDAASASEAVIQWAESHNYHIIKTGSPLDDYGIAVSTPNNPEILLAYKRTGDDIYSCRSQTGGAQGMSYNLLLQYQKADGTEQAWPADNIVRPYSEYATKIEEMEPRYKASAGAAGIDPWNNPNDESWR